MSNPDDPLELIALRILRDRIDQALFGEWMPYNLTPYQRLSIFYALQECKKFVKGGDKPE